MPKRSSSSGRPPRSPRAGFATRRTRDWSARRWCPCWSVASSRRWASGRSRRPTCPAGTAARMPASTICCRRSRFCARRSPGRTSRPGGSPSPDHGLVARRRSAMAGWRLALLAAASPVASSSCRSSCLQGQLGPADGSATGTSGPCRHSRTAAVPDHAGARRPASFRMGSSWFDRQSQSDERPRVEVTIEQPFALGRDEVTFAEWQACLDDGAAPATRRPMPTGARATGR